MRAKVKSKVGVSKPLRCTYTGVHYRYMTQTMSKTEAAEILAAAVPTYARKWNVTKIDVRFYEEVISELRVTAAEGSRLWQAAQIMPAYATVKRAAQ